MLTPNLAGIEYCNPCWPTDGVYIQNCTIFMSGVLDTYDSDHDAIFADIALHGYQQWVPQLTRSGLKGDLYVIFRH